MVRLDDLDRRLISELQQDGYRSHAELARMLGTSKTTIARRIKRLVDDGVMKIVGVLDVKKVGLTTQALICLNIDIKHIDSVLQQLVSKREVHWSVVATGRYDIITFVTVASTAELGQFLRQEIAGIPGILQTETLLVLETRRRGRFLAV